MTDQPEQTPDEDVEDLLTQNARVGITLGTQFTYRGTTHYPKVSIEDGPFIVPDESGESFSFEDGESLLYRVTEVAHRTLDATIARMRRDIDERHSAHVGTPTPS